MRKSTIIRLYLEHIKDIVEELPEYNPSVFPFLMYRDGFIKLRFVSPVPYQENEVTDYENNGKDFTSADLRKADILLPKLVHDRCIRLWGE